MDNNTPHYLLSVAYDLYVDSGNGELMLVEKTSEDHPFQFITGLGACLDAFEAGLLQADSDTFAFTVPVNQAYGPFMEEHVLELEKEIFKVNGKFDETHIYPGAVVPMTNEDGNHFEPIVKEVREDKVVMDFNHPLAGKDLQFKGRILDKHEASNDELQAYLNRGQCDHCGDGEGCCHGHGEGEGCCHGHGEGHGEGCCHGHGEGHGEGCCHGHGGHDHSKA